MVAVPSLRVSYRRSVFPDRIFPSLLSLPVSFQHFVNSCALFARAILCFQHTTNSFAKKRGVGVVHIGGYEPGAWLTK